jgi:hypothetical protein
MVALKDSVQFVFNFSYMFPQKADFRVDARMLHRDIICGHYMACGSSAWAISGGPGD